MLVANHDKLIHGYMFIIHRNITIWFLYIKYNSHWNYCYFFFLYYTILKKTHVVSDKKNNIYFWFYEMLVSIHKKLIPGCKAILHRNITIWFLYITTIEKLRHSWVISFFLCLYTILENTHNFGQEKYIYFVLRFIPV